MTEPKTDAAHRNTVDQLVVQLRCVRPDLDAETIDAELSTLAKTGHTWATW